MNVTLSEICLSFPGGGITALAKETGLPYRWLQKVIYGETKQLPGQDLMRIGGALEAAGEPWRGWKTLASLTELWKRARIARLEADLAQARGL